MSGDLDECTIVISNHVNDWDTFIHALYGKRGFIGKHTLKTWPLIGFIATQA